MNDLQRVAAAPRGDWPDAVPVLPHNFRHAAREAGISIAGALGVPVDLPDDQPGRYFTVQTRVEAAARLQSLLDDMISAGPDGLELDYKTDAALAHEKMKDRTAFVGNLDPSGVPTAGTPELAERKARKRLAPFADTPRFILNAGCAIPAEASRKTSGPSSGPRGAERSPS